MSKAAPARPKKAAKESPVFPAFEMLTGEALRELLSSEMIVRGVLKRPTLDACKMLAASVEILRLEFSKSWRQSAADRDMFKKSLDETWALGERLKEGLRDSLAGFEAELCIEYDHEMALVAGTITEDLVALDQLLGAITSISKCRSLEPAPFVVPPENWHYCADALAKAFRKAMRSTNPVELKYRGSVARFVVAMMGRVTGGEVTEVAVAGHLRREAARKGKMVDQSAGNS